jgi:hypothetical protein
LEKKVRNWRRVLFWHQKNTRKCFVKICWGSKCHF